MGTDSVKWFVLEPLDDAKSLPLVFIDDTWQVVPARPLTTDDRLLVRTATGIVRIQPYERPALGITVHDLSVHSELASARIALPLMERAKRFVRSGRSVFRRTYPLSDILEQAFPEQNSGWDNLSSLLYYDDDVLFFVDLDSEVESRGSDGVAVASLNEPVAVTAGETLRFRLAALPFTDFPELRLTLPERYGIRSLRSMYARLEGRWLDIYLDVPEAYALTRPELEALHESQNPVSTDGYRIRIAPAARAVFRRSLALDLPAQSFAVTSPAILELPGSAHDPEIGVVTPAGRFEVQRGVPFTVGEAGDRSLILRVDRHATSAWFWLGLLGVFGLAALPFVLMARSGRIRHRAEPPLAALVLTVHGLVILRLLASLSAFVAPPFSDESYELSLWLLPFAPWAVLVFGLVGIHTIQRGKETGPLLSPGVLAIGLGASVVPLLVLRGSFRGVVLALLALAIACLGLLVWYRGRLIRVGRGALDAVPLRTTALEVWNRARSAPWWLGLVIGGVFFIARFGATLLGFREMISIAGERLGMSVLYTPLVTLAFAGLLALYLNRLKRARNQTARRKSLGALIVGISLFLVLAYVGASAAVSDWGIALTGLIGPLSLLAFLACLPKVISRVGRVGVVTLVLPLGLFVALQLSPGIVPIFYPGPGSEEDLRMTLWERDELLLLERGDPEQLRLIGQRRSEAIAVMRETLKSYTQDNWTGLGFFDGNVSSEIRPTATQEHTTTALLAGEWGVLGPLTLLGLLILALVPSGWTLPFERGDRARVQVVGALTVFCTAILLALVVGWLSPWLFLVGVMITAGSLGWILLRVPPSGSEPQAEPKSDAAGLLIPWSWVFGVAALLTFAGTGVYMILANYGFAFFTGKNVYLFGLDSVSDSLEALALLSIGAVGLVCSAERVGEGP